VSTRRLTRAVERYFSFAAERFYDRVTVNRVFPLLGGNLNELVLRQQADAVAAARGGPILDMPVGTAYFTVEMARAHSGFVVGADIAEGMVIKAKEAVERAGVDNLEIVRADAHHLPFEDHAFTAIMCSNGLPVIPGLRPTLAELRRVLAPGGTLFVSAISLPVGAVLPVPLPTGFMSSRQLVSAIERAGFGPVHRSRSRLATLIVAGRADVTRPTTSPPHRSP
jgi:ubiquinone/menaquinone biosynthesis C-methylase UbiE